MFWQSATTRVDVSFATLVVVVVVVVDIEGFVRRIGGGRGG